MRRDTPGLLATVSTVVSNGPGDQYAVDPWTPADSPQTRAQHSETERTRRDVVVELGFCLLSADVISADRLEVMPSGSRDQNAVDGLGDEDAEVTGWSKEGYSCS